MQPPSSWNCFHRTSSVRLVREKWTTHPLTNTEAVLRPIQVCLMSVKVITNSQHPKNVQNPVPPRLISDLNADRFEVAWDLFWLLLGGCFLGGESKGGNCYSSFFVLWSFIPFQYFGFCFFFLFFFFIVLCVYVHITLSCIVVFVLLFCSTVIFLVVSLALVGMHSLKKYTWKHFLLLCAKSCSHPLYTPMIVCVSIYDSCRLGGSCSDLHSHIFPLPLV